MDSPAIPLTGYRQISRIVPTFSICFSVEVISPGILRGEVWPVKVSYLLPDDAGDASGRLAARVILGASVVFRLYFK